MMIGLCGFSNTGKTTLTDGLLSLYGKAWGIERIGFADPMIDMLVALGVPRGMIDDKMHWDISLEILSGHTIRDAVDTLGTRWGRECMHPNVWVNVAMSRAWKLQDAGRIVILENVRFPNEFETIRSQGGTIIAINRLGIEPDLTKETERYVPMLQSICDHQFDNSMPIEQSIKAFCALISHLMD